MTAMDTKLGDETILQHARVLWDYHRLEMPIAPSDFVLALGSHDERVAKHGAELVLDNVAPLLVVSGGYGKVTRETWKVTEGERFAEIARALGVADSKILVEPAASNTGENLTKTRELLAQRGIRVESGVLVTKPYMCRRAYAAAAKQWPEIRWSVSCPDLSFDEYPNDEVPLQRMIDLMVGDLQRVVIYAEQGFQIPMDVPPAVWRSYEILRDAGFDRFVLKGGG